MLIPETNVCSWNASPMGNKLPEKISSTAAEGKLRRLSNETHIVTFSNRFTCAVAITAPSSLAHSGRTESGLRKGRRRGRALEAQHRRGTAHGGDAESNMGVEFEPEFLRPLDNVLAMHTARKCLIFHL